jgi:hypothetical protein
MIPGILELTIGHGETQARSQFRIWLFESAEIANVFHDLPGKLRGFGFRNLLSEESRTVWPSSEVMK